MSQPNFKPDVRSTNDETLVMVWEIKTNTIGVKCLGD